MSLVGSHPCPTLLHPPSSPSALVFLFGGQGAQSRVNASGGEETHADRLAKPGLQGTATPCVSSGLGLGVVGGLPGLGLETHAERLVLTVTNVNYKLST
jgi:hypothetical protein